MAIVKRIGPFSALKIGFLVHAFLGLLAGLVCTSIAVAGIPFSVHARMPLQGAFAALPLILCPLLYGIIGGILAVVCALFYNLASGFVGGLEVDI
jgi:hypothetical protein